MTRIIVLVHFVLVGQKSVQQYCLWTCWLVAAYFLNPYSELWQEQVSAQVLGRYSPSLPMFSENATYQGLGDNHRFTRAQSRVSGCVRPQDEIWIINTRDLDRRPCQTLGFSEVNVREWSGDRWQERSPAQLVESINRDSQRQNVLFIHGNRTDLKWASLRGIETYESIVVQPECSGKVNESAPIRWIIWAWLSDPLHGPKKDLTVKRQRAIRQGPCLADFLSQLECPTMGVIGYSLGAQVVVSALDCGKLTPNQQLADGGTVSQSGPRLRVTFIAAALPACWIRSFATQQTIEGQFEHLTLINNPNDRALEIYRKITGESPLGVQATQLSIGIPSDVFLLYDNGLDNHFLAEYLSHYRTRLLIRDGVLMQQNQAVPNSDSSNQITK